MIISRKSIASCYMIKKCLYISLILPISRSMAVLCLGLFPKCYGRVFIHQTKTTSLILHCGLSLLKQIDMPEEFLILLITPAGINQNYMSCCFNNERPQCKINEVVFV